MTQTQELKLVIIANSAKMVLYEAEKNKLINKIQEIKLDSDHHHYHTENKAQLERLEASKEVNRHLEQLVNNNPNKYKGIMLVADPQMLGKIREGLNNNLKQLILMELAKDIVNHDMHSIESIIFSE